MLQASKYGPTGCLGAAEQRCVPEVGVGGVCEGEVGVIEGLNGPNVLPVAVVQVGLHMHAHVLGARDDLAAEIVCLPARSAEACARSACSPVSWRCPREIFDSGCDC